MYVNPHPFSASADIMSALIDGLQEVLDVQVILDYLTVILTL